MEKSETEKRQCEDLSGKERQSSRDTRFTTTTLDRMKLSVEEHLQRHVE